MSNDYGRFNWFELVTEAVDRARAFYPEALPWRATAAPMPGMEYTLFQVGETAIGGLTRPQGDAPSHWLSYVSVEDVDATAKAVRRAGGSTLGEAFDVPTVGRMQPVADPQGGAFCLFRSLAEVPRAEGPGSFHWNERRSADPEALLPFYAKVLGYTHQTMSDGSYFVLQSGNTPRAGLTRREPLRDAPAWVQYVTVEDADATLARATRHGATALVEPTAVEGVGRFAIFRDPTGATLGVITPAS